jgi:hypothetical protein
MKKLFFLALILICAIAVQSQTINWPDFVSKQDLVWTNTVDTNFFHGAFIGDGVQGAMIMQDSKNMNGIRMLMGHYKAIAHYSIPGWEYCDSKVYAGNIIIAPVGLTTYKNMSMNLWDGETNGVIKTTKGEVNWRVFADRINQVFVVVLKGKSGEGNAKLGVREEWGITPRIYLEKKSVADYASHLPPKPVLTKQGDIDLVINKMKVKGAHVVASQLIRLADSTQIIYVAIGTSDIANTALAATNATNDAINRVQAAVAEGYEAITIRHRDWWHNYMQSSFLEIKQDPYWQKFWYLQLYKFASASSENSDLIMDTQGTWIWQSGWAGVWWNLNVQLSYFPMYSANKLDAGRAFINGMNRIYKSGAFKANANGVGITAGRSSTYDGRSNWGEEFGNMPWLLQCYWKYWKYSGNDSIGIALFPMLKDNAVFLSSKLKKGTDGKYHLDPSRSPEYEDNGGEPLNKDTNYGLMSAKWVFQTLLEMNEELGLNDAQKSVWQEKLANMTPLPTDDNGFRVNAVEGFDKGHRHFSHLIGIYPYHIINPDQGNKEKELIEKSLERWQTLTQANGYAGYTFTIGSSMYATLGNGDKALSTLDLMKTHNFIQLNTMYYESGGAVIETPLSGVESIDYMLLQSWNGIIRIFPAVPARWKDISFKDFRTEGAFLVSADYNSGIISGVTIFSEKGKPCTVLNPWKGKYLIVKDENGNMLSLTRQGEKFTFQTKAGLKYFLTSAIEPGFHSGKIEANPKLIQLKLTAPIIDQISFEGITIIKNGADTVIIQQITYNQSDTILELIPGIDLLNTDEIKLNYANGNILTSDSIWLEDINNMVIENLLPGSAPRLLEAKTNYDGTEIELLFSKKMNLATPTSFNLYNSSKVQNPGINSLVLKTGDSTRYVLTTSIGFFLEDTLVLSYSNSDIQSSDGGILLAIDSFSIQNFAHGMPPEIIRGILFNKGSGMQLTFNKNLTDIKTQLPFFVVKINGLFVKINSLSNLFNVVSLALASPIQFGDVIVVSFSGGAINSVDGGVVNLIEGFPVENTIPEIVLKDFVTQSSTEYGGLATLAVDGNTNGNFPQGSVSHTSENTLNPWWTYNLNKLDSIVSINIWNRTDCCGERLSNFYVFLSRTFFATNDPLIVAADPAIWKYYFTGKAGIKTTIKVNTCGQYVRVQIPGIATLSLAEVEVISAVGSCVEVKPNDISEISLNEGIEVYPNPVNGQKFSVLLKGFGNYGNCNFKLFDTLGQSRSMEVKQTGELSELTIKSPIQNGVYFLVLKTDGKTFTKKLVL